MIKSKEERRIFFFQNSCFCQFYFIILQKENGQLVKTLEQLI